MCPELNCTQNNLVVFLNTQTFALFALIERAYLIIRPPRNAGACDVAHVQYPVCAPHTHSTHAWSTNKLHSHFLCEHSTHTNTRTLSICSDPKFGHIGIENGEQRDIAMYGSSSTCRENLSGTQVALTTYQISFSRSRACQWEKRGVGIPLCVFFEIYIPYILSIFLSHKLARHLGDVMLCTADVGGVGVWTLSVERKTCCHPYASASGAGRR